MSTQQPGAGPSATTSRAVRLESFGGPEVLNLREVPAPQAGPGQIRVRVTAAGLNPMDWFMTSDAETATRFGLSLPSESDVVYAADGLPEVNAWVVIRPDETVVIRIMRSEMGQGSLTGLAQLVAEELDCDWSRVTTEFPTPGENLARNRVWGESNTTGSRAIRPTPDLTLEAGMTVVVQPNVATPDGRLGVQTGELVLITSDGIERLHATPREFFRV